jgi:hypothetical protein
MSFDIPSMHFPDESPEAQVILQVMRTERLGPSEAVTSILRKARTAAPERNYIKEGRGLFRNPEDAKILDEAVAIALEERRRPSTQKLA